MLAGLLQRSPENRWTGQKMLDSRFIKKSAQPGSNDTWTTAASSKREKHQLEEEANKKKEGAHLRGGGGTKTQHGKQRRSRKSDRAGLVQGAGAGAGFQIAFKTKAELANALDMWCVDKEAAVQQHGAIKDWNTSLITD